MNRTQLPAPPNPENMPNDVWAKAMFTWASKVKQQVETDSAVNVLPAGPLVVGTYTATNTILGTDATSNFLATMVTLFQQKGLTAANVQRTTT